jgi:flagellar basal-body rod protein FlgB
MDSLAAAITLKALDGLSARASVAAENIANANTPGYRPRRVTFEQALAAAAQHGAAQVRNVTPMIGADATRASLGGTGARVDLDLADSTATAGRYGALVDILDRQLQLTDLVLTETR